MSYPKEPWDFTVNNELLDSEDCLFAWIGSDNTTYEDAKLASRIVKCVNACSGMQNPAEEIQAMRTELSQLRSDKARLVEALEMAQQCIEGRLWKREEAHFKQLLTEMKGTP